MVIKSILNIDLMTMYAHVHMYAHNYSVEISIVHVEYRNYNQQIHDV